MKYYQRYTKGLTFLAFILSLQPEIARSQTTTDRAERLSQLTANILEANQAVLDLQTEAVQASASSRVRGRIPAQSLRERAMKALENRAALMRDLIEESPEQALQIAFSADTSAELENRFPGASAYLETHGKWEGQVETLVQDDVKMSEHRVFHNMEIEGRRYRVRVAGPEPEGSQCGDTIEFEGIELDGVIAAASTKVTKPAATACSTVGDQKSVILLVTFPGVAPPSGVTVQSVYNNFFGTTGRSVNNFWREASYGKTSASGDVFGWFTLDASYSCSNYYSIRDAAYRAVGTSVDLRNYTRVFILFPAPSGCSWAGMSNTGCSTQTAATGSFTASVSWMVSSYFANSTYAVQLPIHEAGHALGLSHARSRKFTTTDPLGALNTQGTINAYGDTQSTMGYWNWGHYNGQQKNALGWQAAGSNVLTVQSSGTYTIAPTELPSTGPQTLKVQRGTGNNAWLWIEYRQPIGSYDTALSSQTFSGALIHYQDAYTGAFNDLLDFNPGTSALTDAVLSVGRTWRDPYSNVSITVNSATSAGLNVTVTYGTATCTRSAPTVTASPTNPSGNAGGSVSYSVTIRNNDSSGCAANTFTLGSSLPSGWGTSFSAASVALNPGQSTTVTMTKNIPAGTTAATYGVNATASSSSPAATGSASCTVLAN